jgi:hypothetical protein
VAGALALGAAVAAVAGCSPSGGSSSATASAPAGQVSSSAASSAASAAASSSGAAASQSPNVVPASSSSAAAIFYCSTQNLKATVVNPEGAAGSVYQNIDFTNVGTTTCELYGYPGVSLGTGLPFAQVGAAAARSTTAAPTLVTLAPGQTGNALLRVVEALNYPQATCSPTSTTYLQIYPPNQTTAIDLAFKSTGCTSNSVNLLSIGVVQAGTGGNS